MEDHRFITELTPGARVKSVYQIRTFRGTPKTVTRPGEFLGFDSDTDEARALVRFDGEEHISHPLLAILEME